MAKNYECKDGVCYLRKPTKKTDQKIIPLPNDSVKPVRIYFRSKLS